MLFSLATCMIAPDRISAYSDEVAPTKAHYAALGIDILLGAALLVIGILATQLGFLPDSVQYAFIGGGVAYTIGTFSAIGLVVKMAIMPGSHLFN